MSNRPWAHAGFTLIEVLIAVVIIGVGIAGVMVAYSTSVKSSADALVGKQLVSIAGELMEEILLKPYAVSGAVPGHGSAVCGDAVANRSTYDDVRDYDGYQTTGICNIDGQTIAGLEAYNVAVGVNAGYSLSGVGATLRVTVTVTNTRNPTDRVVLDGFRTNY